MATGVLVGRGYVSIRPEFEGDWSRSVNARASSAGRSGAGAFSKAFGAGLKTVGGLAAVAVAANISNIAAASAALAPALATAGTAAAALKLGLSGVGEAFKAAFADSSAQASSAASATRAVEGAQRGLANAQRALADARVQAAERVREAQRQVVDAERELTDAQRDARQAQGELNGARQDAARALQDMNQQLAESRLGEREAVLRLKQATNELKAAESRKGVTPDELERLRIAYERARLNLTEQRTETKRLADDTQKANKAGIEGSQQVLSAKERISEANRTVADRERALGEAQAGVTKARVEGQRSIADAQRAVADAAAAVADAQAAAAAQTSKLDQAMAKLAPNARSFVNAIRGLAPAWTAMRMSVQNELFRDLGSHVAGLARDTIPILGRQLSVTAGLWNTMGRSAIDATRDMAQSGMLEQILQGANRSFAKFKDTPGQLVTAFGQLSLAAQPAFERLMGQFSGAIKHFTDGIAASFTSGGLKQGIDTAFQILSQLGTLLGNAFGVVTQIFKAASDAGGQIIGVLSAVFKEIGRILALPEVQAQLRTLFGSVAQIVGAIVPVLGAVVQAVVPLLAAIAPVIASIAQAVGPLLSQLATALSAALMPIITTLGPVLVQLVTSLTSALTPIIAALLPVITQVGVALLQIVQAVTPLLAPIGQLITSVITALAPALTPIINIVTQLVKVLVGPLTSVIQALTPAFVLVGQLIAKVFQALEPFLAPLVELIGQVAAMLAGIFSRALSAVMGAIQPLIPVGIQLVQSVIGALAPILPTLGSAIEGIAGAFLQLLGPLSEVWASLAQQLAPVIASLAPIFAQLAGILAGALAAALPPLIDALMILFGAFKPIFPLVAEILGIVVSLGANLLKQLLPPLMQLIQAGVDLVVALLPILPPLATIIGLVVQLAVKVLSWLLPPLVQLASFFIGKFAGALGTAIGWLASLIGIIAKAVAWVVQKLGPAFIWLNEHVVQPVWRAIQTAVRWAWENVLRPIWQAIGNWIMTRLVPAMIFLKNNAGNVFKIIGAVVGTAWTLIRPIFNALRTAVGKVSDAFTAAKKTIGDQWSKLVDIAKKPIAFIINTVYNHGIVPVWNKVIGTFGGKTLPEFHPKGFATGGYTGPGGKHTPAGIVHAGEFVTQQSSTAKIERSHPGALDYMNRTGLLPGFKDGGLVDDILGGLSGAARKVGGVVAGVGDLFADPGKIWQKLTGPIRKLIAGMGDTQWIHAIGNIPSKMLTYLKDKLVDSAGSFVGGIGEAVGLGSSGGGGSGVKRWTGVVQQSLRMLGQPAAYTDMTLRRMNQESGGNPNIVNKWDSNWLAGHPSVGLMQVIGPTFRSYAGKLKNTGPFSYGVSVNPLANVYSSMRYALAAYGSLPRAYNRAGGYDAGGWLQPGVTTAFNATGQPEAVLTASQWRSLSTVAATGGMALDGQRLRLVVGDREFDAYVDSRAQGQVHATLRPLASAARAGRKGV